ncbi:hypothetical protein [Lactococcus petauri]|uniref:hypothetical protein n=2 Tax=Lactococcus petauri TaxID=1940789 RepID=UPI002016BFAE|nr:hypothetical protein [Lactococcus petauri]
MVQSQYEELFTQSEDLLKQMTYILDEPDPSSPPNIFKSKKKRLKRWFRSGIILFILFFLLFTLAIGGGKFLQIIGRHIPLRYEVEVQSKPQQMSEKDLEASADDSSDNMARIRVSLEIKAEKQRNAGRVVIQNLPSNDTRLRFTVLADGETEPLFRSELIDPGYAVTEIPLQKQYLNGKHKGQLLLEFYEMEQENKIAESSVEIMINAADTK